MAQVIVTPQARWDVDEAISALGLSDDAWTRIARSLRPLETFPLAGASIALLGALIRTRSPNGGPPVRPGRAHGE